jgi:hypothetical protein
MNAELQVNQWSQIVAEALQDEDFKNRLLAEPEEVLKEHGMEVPQGIEVRVVENSSKVLYLTLPAQLKEGELSESELEGVAGGNPFVIGMIVGAIAVPALTTAVVEGAGADVISLGKKYADQKRGKK